MYCSRQWDKINFSVSVLIIFLVCICIAFNIDSFHGVGGGSFQWSDLVKADRSASQLTRV